MLLPEEKRINKKKKKKNITVKCRRNILHRLQSSRMSLAVAITTILFILVTVDIVGNTLVCAIILKYRNMRTPMNFLIFNLAVADALFAVFITPKLIVSLNLTHPEGLAGAVLCKLITGGAIGWVAGVCSIYTLVSISIERYLTVLHPNGNKWKLSIRKVKVIIAVAWFCATISNFPTFYAMEVNKNNKCVENLPAEWMLDAFNIYVNVVIVFGPMFVMLVLYFLVLYTLWVKSRKVTQQVTPQQRGVLRIRKRVTLVVVTITVIFAICWGTIQVLYTLSRFTSYKMSHEVVAISNVMVLFNSAVNPFVYALLNHNFRDKIRGIIRCCDSAVGPAPEPQNRDIHS